MQTSPVSEVQLLEVQKAVDEFRAYWESFREMPSLGGFSGALKDIHALDYLDYEGLGYPPSGLAGAALVWGNVLACQLEMAWVTDSDGHLLLEHDVPGSRITVWPYARVLEVQGRGLPQFGKYTWILEGVVRDCLEYGDLSDRARDWAQQVVRPLPFAKTIAQAFVELAAYLPHAKFDDPDEAQGAEELVARCLIESSPEERALLRQVATERAAQARAEGAPRPVIHFYDSFVSRAGEVA